MADCTDPTNEKLSAAFPGKLTADTPTGVQINECAINTPVFDINALLKVAQNYVRLNQSINVMLGTEVRWFRAVPQQRSKDVIFQEYTLSNVEDVPLCIKVMLPDGNFPDSKYNYDLMGLEYEVPLEVQIDKVYWEAAAGRGTAPQKKDIIYFPIPNKLYQVESSFLARGFMEQETTWRINLKKYMPEASRREAEALKQTIDDYTVSAEEIFGDDMNKDINKIANDRQNSPYNSTVMDKYKILNGAMQVITQDLDIYGVKVSSSYYDLSTADSSVAVTYPIRDVVSTIDDRSMSVWFKIKENTNKEYAITIQPDNTISGANFKIVGLDGTFEPGDVINVYRQGSINVYGTHILTTVNGHYFYIPPRIVGEMESIRIDWYNLRNYRAKLETPINIITGISPTNDVAVTVDIFARQYIEFRISGQTHTAVLSDKLNIDEWYGSIFNMGNIWNQFNIYLWKQHETDEINKISNVYYETMKISKQELQVQEYQIKRSNSSMRNIRLYNATIEEEKQPNELLSYFIKDGDHAIINDLCEPRYKSPYVGRQR